MEVKNAFCNLVYSNVLLKELKYHLLDKVVCIITDEENRKIYSFL